MKTKKRKQTDKLSIAVIVNELSHEQLEILGKHFAQATNQLNVLLVKQIPCFPIAFYRLSEILLLEKQLSEEAKKALYQASSHFNIPLMRKVIQDTTLMHVFQALPKIDHVIGHGLDKTHFFLGSQHPSFVGNVRRWIEMYDVDDGDMQKITLKEISRAFEHDRILLPASGVNSDILSSG